jgi:hypothetical protein
VSLAKPVDQVADTLPAMAIVGAVFPIDDDGRAVGTIEHRTAKDGGRTCPRRRV